MYDTTFFSKNGGWGFVAKIGTAVWKQTVELRLAVTYILSSLVARFFLVFAFIF